MDKASDVAVKSIKILAKSAAKKGVQSDSVNSGATTRATDKLKPVHANVTKFTLKNLSLAKTMDEFRFQLQEMVGLVLNQFQKINLSKHEQSILTAFMLKEFQRAGIFANCDNVVYHSEGNTVSYSFLYL